MRILHALSQRPGRTGSGIFLQQLFKEASKKGYEQAVIAGVPNEERVVDIPGLKKENFFPVFFQSDELNFAVAGMSDVMPYESTKFSDFDEKMFESYKKSFSTCIKKAVESFKPDVVISNHLWIMSALIKELYPNLKVICLCHGTDLRQIELSPKLCEYVKKHINKGDHILALNENQKQIICEKYRVLNERIAITGSGYDDKTFCYSKKPKTPPVNIVYVGKMSNAKGVPELLNAFEKISLHVKEITLTLIGGGSGKESEEIIKKAQSMLGVEYLGFVEQERLIQRFQQSHVFVLPSFFEGLPLVVIEALASGMRVVTTRLPGLAEFIGEELQEAGAISYVDLPKMKSVDTPLASEIDSFEQRLSEALYAQIQSSLKEESLQKDILDKELCKKSWKGLFERIEKFF